MQLDNTQAENTRLKALLDTMQTTLEAKELAREVAEGKLQAANREITLKDDTIRTLQQDQLTWRAMFMANTSVDTARFTSIMTAMGSQPPPSQ